MKVGPLLAGLREAETALGVAYETLGQRHAADHDVFHQCRTFSEQCERHVGRLAGFYGEDDGPLWQTVTARPAGPSETGVDLLRDLRTLFLAAEDVSITWVMVGQAAQALRDRALLDAFRECHGETELQVKWLTTRIKVGAPQALVVGR